jgi:hypothetical protein
MNLRVKAIALTLAGLATFSGGYAAYAEDEDDKLPFPGETHAPRAGHHPHPDENELHDRYGEDIGQINLPPLVVKDGQKTGSAGHGLGEQLNPPANPETLKDAGNADPAGNVPVDPKSIKANQGSPADVFFNSATVGLGVMGAGALALGGFAVRRSIKLRKDPKADFLYE